MHMRIMFSIYVAQPGWCNFTKIGSHVENYTPFGVTHQILYTQPCAHTTVYIQRNRVLQDENDRNIANIGRIFEFQDAVDSCGHFTCDTITKHTNLDHFA